MRVVAGIISGARVACLALEAGRAVLARASASSRRDRLKQSASDVLIRLRKPSCHDSQMVNSRRIVMMAREGDFLIGLPVVVIANVRWSQNPLAHLIWNRAKSLRPLHTSKRSSAANSLSSDFSENGRAYLPYSRNRRFKRSFSHLGVCS